MTLDDAIDEAETYADKGLSMSRQAAGMLVEEIRRLQEQALLRADPTLADRVETAAVDDGGWVDVDLDELT